MRAHSCVPTHRRAQLGQAVGNPIAPALFAEGRSIPVFLLV